MQRFPSTCLFCFKVKWLAWVERCVIPALNSTDLSWHRVKVPQKALREQLITELSNVKIIMSKRGGLVDSFCTLKAYSTPLYSPNCRSIYIYFFPSTGPNLDCLISLPALWNYSVVSKLYFIGSIFSKLSHDRSSPSDIQAANSWLLSPPDNSACGHLWKRLGPLHYQPLWLNNPTFSHKPGCNQQSKKQTTSTEFCESHPADQTPVTRTAGQKAANRNVEGCKRDCWLERLHEDFKRDSGT